MEQTRNHPQVSPKSTRKLPLIPGHLPLLLQLKVGRRTPRAPPEPQPCPGTHLFIYSFRTAHGALHCFLVLPQLTTIIFQKAGKEPIQKIMGCSIQTHDLYFCKPQSFHVQISIVCSKIPLSSSNVSIKNTFSHF